MKARNQILWLLGFALGACASYTPSSAPIAEPSVWTVKGDYAVAVDPFVETDRQLATFDADLNEADVIAIQVVADNRSRQRVLVRRSDMALAVPVGGKFAPSGITSVVNKVGESGSVVGATIAFGIIGAIAASSAEDDARTARTADYKEKAFKDATLEPGDSARGFVFFIPPRGTEPFDDAKLHVRFIDFDTATSEIVEVPLSGLDYVESKEKNSE